MMRKVSLSGGRGRYYGRKFLKFATVLYDTEGFQGALNNWEQPLLGATIINWALIGGTIAIGELGMPSVLLKIGVKLCWNLKCDHFFLLLFT